MATRRTDKSTRILTGAFAPVGLLLLLGTDAALSKEPAWYRYENPYFIADSNARQKNTLAVLTDLELFRAAVLQVANLRVPESAPKTKILIMRTKQEFASVACGPKTGGFALRYDDGRFLIVVPASTSTSWAKSVIRHEYTHVLLGFRNFDYPKWYEEGFAELTSTISFRDKDTAFVFGEAPIVARYAGLGALDWNRLVAEDFDIHSMSYSSGSGAYYQSWLLTHYVTLGDDFGNTPNLLEYFRMIAGGEPSLPAFERAFGMDANDLWRRKLRPYSKRFFTLAYKFSPDALHTEFRRSDSDVEAIQSLISELQTRKLCADD